MPLGGGTIESVSAYGGPTNSAIPVHVSGKQIWPNGRIRAHETLSVQVVVKRPSSVAWLTGKTEHLNLTLTTPSAHLKAHFLTVGRGPAAAAAVRRARVARSPRARRRRSLTSPGAGDARSRR